MRNSLDVFVGTGLEDNVSLTEAIDRARKASHHADGKCSMCAVGDEPMNIKELRATATPGPWDSHGPSISAKGHGYIAKALEVYMDRKRREANARLICHCVNTHQGLLDALKLAENLLTQHEEPAKAKYGTNSRTLTIIRTSIKAAEGVT